MEIEYLTPPHGTMEAHRVVDLEKSNVFIQVDINNMLTGQYAYLPFTVKADRCSSCEKNNDEGQLEESWGYLGKVILISEEIITFSMADAHELVGTDAEAEQSTLDYALGDGENKVWIAVGQPASPGSVFDPERASAALMELTSVKSLESDQPENKWASRIKMIAEVVKAVAAQPGASASDIGEVYNSKLQEAIDAIEAGVSQDAPKPKTDQTVFGQKKKNLSIIGEVFAAKAPPAESGKDAPDLGAKVDAIMEAVKCLEKNMKQLKLSTLPNMMPPPAARPVAAAAHEDYASTADFVPMSLRTKGKCQYHALGCLSAAAEGLSFDEIFDPKYDAQRVKAGQKATVEALIEINEGVENIARTMAALPKDIEERRKAHWAELLAMSFEDILSKVRADHVWGEYVTAAAGAWGTDVECVIIHDDSISAKASDSSVRAGFHPALLEGFPQGPVKKKCVFICVRNSHYHVGYVTKNGKKQVLFDKGDAENEAMDLMVAALKSKAIPRISQMSHSERSAHIEKALKGIRPETAAGKPAATSYAAAVGHGGKPTNIGSRQGSRSRVRSSSRSLRSSQTPTSRAPSQAPRPKSQTACRNGATCKFGDKCHFTHANPTDKAHSASASTGWQTVGGRNKRRQKMNSTSPKKGEAAHSNAGRGEPVLRVYNKDNVHPGTFRNMLKRDCRELHAQTSWVSCDGNWLVVHAKKCNVEELLKWMTPLRKDKYTVNAVQGPICATYISRQECQHRPSCCK